MTRNGNTIYADEGKYLTNGTAYGTMITLGNNDSPANWKEVDYMPSDDPIDERDEALKILGVIIDG